MARAKLKSGGGKRADNKKDVDNVNRTALIIGGAAAIIILAVMIYSFCM